MAYNTGGVPAQTSNPYGLYQAPGYTPGYITGAANNPATAQPVNTLYNQTIPSMTSTVQGMNTTAPTTPILSSKGFGSLVNNAVQAYAQTLPDPANPYGLYQAPGYVQGQVTQGYTPSQNAQGQRATAIAPERIEYAPVAQSDANIVKNPVLNANSPIFQGKNAALYQQMVQAVKGGANYNPTDEMDFYRFARDTTGTSNLPSQQTGFGTAANPLSAYAKQNIIPLNPTMHDYWIKTTNPANPNDPNAFAQWADVQGAPLKGISAQEQYAAFKEAKAKGTTPVAPTPVQSAPVQSAPVQQAQQSVAPAAAPVQPASVQPASAPTAAPVQQTPAPAPAAPPAQPVTLENWRDSIDGPATGQPIVTPTFASTGAVRIPTATVTPTPAGYTASRTQAPTGPSRPGYTAPSGRVYANWVPKRKVT